MANEQPIEIGDTLQGTKCDECGALIVAQHYRKGLTPLVMKSEDPANPAISKFECGDCGKEKSITVEQIEVFEVISLDPPEVKKL